MIFHEFHSEIGDYKETAINRSPEIEDISRELINLGFRFEIELLKTGDINMECVKPQQDDKEDSFPELLSIIICPNDLRVPFMVDQLVRKAKDHYDLINKIKTYNYGTA